MAELHLKTKLIISNVPFDFEIVQVDEGVITGFRFDGRKFSSHIKPVRELFSCSDSSNEVKVGIKAGTSTTILDKVLEKHCSKCNQTKPASDFNINTKDRTGLQAYCRDCYHKLNKALSKKHQELNKKKKKSVKVKPDLILLPGEKPVLTPRKSFDWNKERDKILVDNFDELGVSGIFDKSLLPGFSLADIRHRCQELNLIDRYGNKTRGVNG